MLNPTFAFILLLCCLMNFSFVTAEYPIVLLPGFLGWGRSDLEGSIKYFGGFHGDVQEELKSIGHEVYTVSGGPVSSSWDRVAEIFAELKGGVVDYGKSHSSTNKHLRFVDRKNAGVYPEWGTKDENGNIRKVHLVSHSFGGMDCRLLTHLLNFGNEAEIASGDDVSLLYKGGNDWVASCTTISTPHDGTSLATVIFDYFPAIETLVLGFASIFGFDSNNHLYDFKLQQWGLERGKNESFKQYFEAIFKSSAWIAQKDNAIFDLKPDGSALLNDYIKVVPHVYYFTYSTTASRNALLDKNIQVPTTSMNAILWPVSTVVGFFTRPPSSTDIPITDDWHANDGIVNTKSMSGPTVGFNSQRDIPAIVNYSSKLALKTGVFYNMPKLEGWDHLSIVGAGLWSVSSFYKDVANLITSVPSTVSSSLSKTITLTMNSNVNVQSSENTDNTPTICQNTIDYYNFICVNNQNTSYMSSDDCARMSSEMSVANWCESFSQPPLPPMDSSVSNKASFFLRK